MTGIVRLGDLNMGHTRNDQTPAMTPSRNVFANGLPVMQIGDTYAEHHNHVPVHMAGSNNVFVNGVPAANWGTVIICPPNQYMTIVNGSPNVIING